MTTNIGKQRNKQNLNSKDAKLLQPEMRRTMNKNKCSMIYMTALSISEQINNKILIHGLYYQTLLLCDRVRVLLTCYTSLEAITACVYSFTQQVASGIIN